jgi:hypothetical protein
LGQLATALERSEAELVNDVIARVAFNEPERVRVEQWARQAQTIALLTAERAGSSGTRLSDNVLFHEIALRWSPAYVAALERGPGRVPSEMMPETLQAARNDIKAAGLRLQLLLELVTQGRGWLVRDRPLPLGPREPLQTHGQDQRVERALQDRDDDVPRHGHGVAGEGGGGEIAEPASPLRSSPLRSLTPSHPSRYRRQT